MHKEALWLDGQCRSDLQLVVGVVGPDVKVLENLPSAWPLRTTHRCDREQRFLPGKGSADTSADPIAKRLPRVGREVGKTPVEHPFRSDASALLFPSPLPELLHILAPDLWVPVQRFEYDKHGRVSGDAVLSRHNLLLGDRRDGEARCRGLESEGFLECRVNVLELVQLGKGYGVRSADSVHFLADLGRVGRVLQEVVEEEGEESRGGLRSAERSLPLPTSCPAMRNVTSWYRMLTGSSPLPVTGSRPCSIASRRSFCLSPEA